VNSANKRQVGPAVLVSWLVPGSFLWSSYFFTHV